MEGKEQEEKNLEEEETEEFDDSSKKQKFDPNVSAESIFTKASVIGRKVF
jgi:hypothetical protein